MSEPPSFASPFSLATIALRTKKSAQFREIITSPDVPQIISPYHHQQLRLNAKNNPLPPTSISFFNHHSRPIQDDVHAHPDHIPQSLITTACPFIRSNTTVLRCDHSNQTAIIDRTMACRKLVALLGGRISVCGSVPGGPGRPAPLHIQAGITPT